MKFLIVSCTFIVFAVTVVVGNLLVERNDPGGTRIAIQRVDPVCTKQGPQCTEDCTTLLLCSSFSTEPLSKSPCTAPKQYCVNGACTSNKGTNCQTGGGSAGSKITCTDTGIFPDPSDCTQYHICDDKESVPFQCSSGFVYNSQLKMCQFGKTPCTKISCSKEKDLNIFVPYTSNPAYYAFCTKDDGGAYQVYMFKCPYEDFEVFDVKSSECKFKCKAKGNYQNPAECNEYYYCSGVNAQPILEVCPDQWVFDGTGCNKDATKCQHLPKIELSVEVDADTALEVQGFLDGLKDEINTVNCKLESNPNCPILANVVLVAKRFRTQTVGDDTIYFVSVLLNDKAYHVRIKVPQVGAPTFENITKEINLDAKIEHFDAA